MSDDRSIDDRRREVEEHLEKLEAATVEDLDDLLHDLFCLAWPTTDAQDN